MKKILIWLLLLSTISAEAQFIGPGRRGKSGSGGSGGSFTKSSTDTLKNKTIDGTENTLKNIPYSALTGTPTIPTNYITTNSAQTGLTGDKSTVGLWNYTAPWSTGQVNLGSTGQGAKLNFSDGTTGSATGYIGFNSATSPQFILSNSSSSGMVIRNAGATGFLSLEASGASGFLNFFAGNVQAGRWFPSGNLRIGTNTTDDGNKLRVDGSAYIGSITAGNITPVATNTYSLGSNSLNWSSVNTNVVASAAGLILDKAASGGLHFRNAGTNYFGGSFLTSGNWYFQAPSASLPTDTGERVQINGTSSHTDMASFTGPFSGQASFGSNGQAGNIIFKRGSDGATQASVGYSSAASAGDFLINSQGGAGTLSLASTGYLNFNSNGTQTARMQNGRTIFGTSTTDNAAWLVQIGGTARITGLVSLDTGLSGGSWVNNTGITPDASGTRDIGSSTNRFSAVWSTNFLSNTAVSFGTSNTTGDIYFRQGSGTQLLGGFKGTTGNLILQSSNSTLTDDGAGLQLKHSITAASGVARGANVTPTLVASANGDTKVGLDVNPTFTDGAFTGQNNYAFRVTGGSQFVGDVMPGANSIYASGATSAKWSSVFANNFLGAATTVAFGNASSTSPIVFRQGTGSNLVGGFYPTTGNFTIQAGASGLGTDTGERLQVMGTTYLGGATSVLGDLIPGANTSYNFGNATRLWNAVYTNQVRSASPLQLFSNGINGWTMATTNGDIRMIGLQTLSNTSAGHKYFNTSDETTNTETANIGWSSNAFLISTAKAGTGVNRDMNFQSTGNMSFSAGSATRMTFGSTTETGGVNLGYATSSSGAIVAMNPVLSGSTTTQKVLSLIPTINRSGSSEYHILYVSPYEQATGSGERNLWNFGLNTAANNAGTHTPWFKGTLNGSTLRVLVKGMPTYEDNATALAALGADVLYKTSTGDVRITY